MNVVLAARSAVHLLGARFSKGIERSAYAEQFRMLPISVSSAFGRTMTPDQLRALAARVQRSFALGALDRLDLLAGQRVDEVVGGAVVERLRDAKQGFVVGSLHYGPLYFVPWETAHFGVDVKALMLDDLAGLSGEDFTRTSARGGIRYEGLIARSAADVRRALAALKGGGAVTIYADGMSVAGGARDREHHSADVDFLGVPLRVRTSPAWFAAAARVPIVPALAYRAGLGKRGIVYGDPIAPPDRDDADGLAAATRALWAWFETRVKREPEQWGSWIAPYVLWREAGGSPRATVEDFERVTREVESRLDSGRGRLVAEPAHVGVLRGERPLLVHGPERRVLDADLTSIAVVEAALRRTPLARLAGASGVPRERLAREVARVTLAGLATIED